MSDSNLVNNSVDEKPISISCTVYPEPLDIWFDMPRATVVIKYYYIYKTTNLLNGMIYVGKHEPRDNPHDKYLGSGLWLGRVINKYGKQNFKREIIEYCNGENINEREKYWIAELKSNDPKIGYNLTAGGEGISGLKHSEKSRFQMSKSQIIRWTDPEARQQQSEIMTVINNDPERRHKVSETMTIVSADPEWRCNLSEKMIDYWDNPEKRQQQSEIMTIIRADPEWRHNHSEKMLDYWDNPEWACKQSESIKAGWTPEVRQQQSEKSSAIWADPERQSKQSEKQKSCWADPEKKQQRSEAIRAGWARRHERLAAEKAKNLSEQTNEKVVN